MQQKDWTTAADGSGEAIVPRLTGWMMDAFGVSGAQWLLMSFMGLLCKRNQKLRPGIYNAYITVTKEHALRKAKRLEKKWNRGKKAGMLFGIPLSYKDNQGVRTTNGSEIYRSFVPDRTATVIRRANKENAIMLGKINMHEFALGITSNNPHYGPVRNPWNVEYSPGGSIGGSAAAVAANLSVASIGIPAVPCVFRPLPAA
ncbi:amidase [Paenibacillus thiaminolyticus]|uniref:amidase family protein n=1 Tax=Paenibacillus thiaminolyticus TaxID=49283 RepID=UPI0035A6D7E4